MLLRGTSRQFLIVFTKPLRQHSSFHENTQPKVGISPQDRQEVFKITDPAANMGSSLWKEHFIAFNL